MGKRSQAPADEGGEKVPLWYISFADMITLLLAFFVMLQTMSTAQDAALMGASRDSFRRAISGLGIPDLLFGKEQGPDMDYQKLKYPTEPEPDPIKKDRVIDADGDRIRKTFEELKKSCEIRSSDDVQKPIISLTPRVNFEPGAYELDEASKQALAQNLQQLRQVAASRQLTLEVVGFAPEEKDPQASLTLGSLRAFEAAKYLRQELATENACELEVHTSGAMSDSAWAAKLGATSGKKLLIAVMAREE